VNKAFIADDFLIGAHTSAQGGVYNALLQGKEIGATTIQLFTSNQKQWKGRILKEEDIARWKEAIALTGLHQIMSHDSYLINLGSPSPELLHKSRQSFREELSRCHQLDISFLNFHPGTATVASEEECLKKIVESLLEFENLADQGKTRFLIENTAGQGTTVGHRFEHLGYLIERLHTKIPIGICLDTCHLFAAGYDIRTKKGWDDTLEQFDRHVGLKHLYALHVNDSIKPLGARVDRHAALGEGQIGLECFKILMRHPSLRQLPKYLETPDGPPLWKKEIQMLREFSI
jgi:deoxyribonuclease IV